METENCYELTTRSEDIRDSIYNRFPARIHITTTNKTEPMVVDGKFFPRYPYIRQGDIGQNTSNMFINSLQICNLFLDGLNGDYDGDTTTDTSIYSVEANEEIEKAMKSKYNFISFGGKPIRNPGNEAFQSIYNLTMSLPETKDKLSVPVFGKL